MRYLDAVSHTMGNGSFAEPGAETLLSPPREQRAVFEALAQLDGGWTEVDLGAVEGLPPGSTAAVVGLPPKAEAPLRALNRRRDWLQLRGVRLLLILDPDEYRQFDLFAPDTASATPLRPAIPFEPRPVDVSAARRALRESNRLRWQRLDLRGLIRAEGEDVGWPLQVVYQDLQFRTLRSKFDLGPLPLRWLTGGSLQLSRRRQATGLLLVGPPGSGKTFFLRHLATSDGGALAGMVKEAVLLAPVAALGRVRSTEELTARLVSWMLESGLDFAHCFEEELRLGRVTVLLDGLDEVGDSAARIEVAAAVDDFARAFPKCPIVVTTRTAGWTEAPPRALVPIELLPLHDGQIRTFLRQWCELYAMERSGGTGRQAGVTEGERLAEEVLRNP